MIDAIVVIVALLAFFGFATVSLLVMFFTDEVSALITAVTERIKGRSE